MKHKKEWRTCDRCDAKIKIKPMTKMSFQMCGVYGDVVPKYEDEDLFEKVTYTHFLKWNYELCPKCRKDFVRFMRNEHGRSN